MNRIRGLAAVVCAGAIALSGCSSGKKSSASTTSTTSDVAQQGNQSPLPSSSGTKHTLINDAAGKYLMTADIQGSLAIVQDRDQLLTGRTPSAGRRVYALNGADVLDIRSTSDGFKVNDPTGATKWTVKVGADKTQISQGTSTVLYTIETPNSIRSDVKKGSTAAGTVEQAGGKTTIKSADGTSVATVADGPFLPGYGVLLMKEIPENDQAVIIAELIARNQQ